MTRSKHLQWCKDRAGEYLDRNDIPQAWASFASDMGKHSETRGHGALELGRMHCLGGLWKNPEDCRRFIDGFN